MFFLNIIGSFGLFFDEIENLILFLTPINILILLVLFYWANDYRKKSFIFTLTLIFLFGFLVEFIGVQYKFIFGDYSYGNALGLKIFQTPLIIGVNWINLSLACFGISSFFVRNNFLVALIACVVTFLDYYLQIYYVDKKGGGKVVGNLTLPQGVSLRSKSAAGKAICFKYGRGKRQILR